jgi:hypothetical protein
MNPDLPAAGPPDVLPPDDEEEQQPPLPPLLPAQKRALWLEVLAVLRICYLLLRRLWPFALGHALINIHIDLQQATG